MSVLGYIRVSSDDQKTENQKLIILEYANQQKFKVDKWIEIKMSSRRSTKERKIDELLVQLQPNDTLIVTELSRLGRSVGQIAILVNDLIAKKVRLLCLKEAIDLTGKAKMQNKIMITMFSLFAEIERDLISERTKEGLARARAEGKLLGRPKGALGKSKLDGKQTEIQSLLHKGVNVTNLARIFDVSRPTIVNFIRTRKINNNRAIKIHLYLRVENNSKFVRGKKKVRQEIEDYILRQYDMKIPGPNDWEYELTIPYKNEKDLDNTIYDMLSEMERTADYRNCFIEVDVTAEGSDKSW